MSQTCHTSCNRLQDFGKGWTNLTANSNGLIAAFWDFDWGANLHRSERRTFPDETILATVYERADQMKGLTPGWDKDMHFVHSTDFFKSAHTKLAACGNQFELIGHKVSATKLSGEHFACAPTQHLPAYIDHICQTRQKHMLHRPCAIREWYAGVLGPAK